MHNPKLIQVTAALHMRAVGRRPPGDFVSSPTKLAQSAIAKLPKFTLEFGERKGTSELQNNATDKVVKTLVTKEGATERGALKTDLGAEKLCLRQHKNHREVPGEVTNLPCVSVLEPAHAGSDLCGR